MSHKTHPNQDSDSHDDDHHRRKHHRRHRRLGCFRPLILILGLFFLFNIARTTGYNAGWQEGYFFAQTTAEGAAPPLAHTPEMARHGFSFFSLIGAIIKFWFFFIFFAMMAKFIFFRRRWAWGQGHHDDGHGMGNGRWHNHDTPWSGPKPPWWQADHPDRNPDATDDDDPLPPHKADLL